MHSKEIELVMQELKVQKEVGLNQEEIRERQSAYGLNQLREPKKKSLLTRFADQFKDAMIVILMIAAGISFLVALNGEESSEFFEPMLIILIVVLNAVLGVVQESKAEKALEALKRLSAPQARVIRNGAELVIDAAQVVPGDIVMLEAGDFVPADARLIESASLKAEESALTGESVASEKDARVIVAADAPIGDRSNMIYSGTSITYGRCKAVVTGTGMSTEMGRIADLLEGAGGQSTPLQKKLAQLGRYLGFLALAICAVIFVIGLLNGMEILSIFMISVSLAVSAIPEGLPAIVTIVLSLGVQRMVKQNAIIKNLPAVETLGSASVICSDKTGTLTQNRMTLIKAYVGAEDLTEDISSSNTDKVRNLLQYAALCCDGSVIIENGTEKHIGDPTETSIVLAAMKNGMPKEELAAKFPRLAELPFDSDRKLMSVVCQMDDKKVVITKGAFDMMMPRCNYGDMEHAKAVTESMSEEALRVIAVAYKYIEEIPAECISEEIENDLHFLGLVAMIDPPREEAKEAVALCKRAGIRPIMITGDHVVTATAIAKQLGIFKDGDKAVTGAYLDELSEEALNEQVRDISVYARVSPENKIRIVRAWQKQDEIVAMTGDGVNDAPALKAADIGCAMGITGTDVAKGAADMTLTDDNFATIVEAVKEGRSIYDNIKKAVFFLLGTNIGEVFTVFFAMLLWRKSPLLSMQLLLINMVTDSLPAIAIGMEKPEDDVMDRKPKKASEGIFANGMGLQVLLMGVMFGALTLLAFFIGKGAYSSSDTELAAGRTMAFIVLSLSQVVHASNMRTHKSLFKAGVFSNKFMNLAALTSFAVTVFVVFVPPVANVFGLAHLTLGQYLIAFGLVLVPLPVMELVKALKLSRF